MVDFPVNDSLQFAFSMCFPIKKSRKLSICPLFYSVWHLVSFNMLLSINLKQKDTKTLGFSIPEKIIKPKNIHGFIHVFLQLSISMGHNCPRFYSPFRCQDV